MLAIKHFRAKVSHSQTRVPNSFVMLMMKHKSINRTLILITLPGQLQFSLNDIVIPQIYSNFKIICSWKSQVALFFFFLGESTKRARRSLNSLHNPLLHVPHVSITTMVHQRLLKQKKIYLYNCSRVTQLNMQNNILLYYHRLYGFS